MRLRARDVAAGYGKTVVLRGVDVEIGAGEVVAVLGPNGAGKSTLCKTLFGLLSVQAGTVEVDGAAVVGWRAESAVAAGIGYVPQTGNVFAELTVAENLDLSGARSAPDLLGALYQRFPVLADRASQSAGSLSGGERQCLALTMALVAQPQILILDEPTTGLSPVAAQSLTDWIIEIAGDGTGICWVVEQDPAPVLAAASRAYLLDSGQVRYAGPARELSDSDAYAMVFNPHGHEPVGQSKEAL